MVNDSVVTPLPSNGVLMGLNGLLDWLCNCPECLLMDRIEWPRVPVRSANLLPRQYNFVIIQRSGLRDAGIR